MHKIENTTTHLKTLEYSRKLSKAMSTILKRTQKHIHVLENSNKHLKTLKDSRKLPETMPTVSNTRIKSENSRNDRDYSRKV